MSDVAFPLYDKAQSPPPTTATSLSVGRCPIEHARELVRLWHSRMPVTQKGPWSYAFSATHDGRTYGVALWHNPSARMLPWHWIELRRLAVGPLAPHCTASRMLGQMAQWFRRNAPEHEKMISYQDTDVHTGTIYRAAGWEIANTTRARIRDRSTKRPNGRIYRVDANGLPAHTSEKVRWEMPINRAALATETPGEDRDE